MTYKIYKKRTADTNVRHVTLNQIGFPADPINRLANISLKAEVRGCRMKGWGIRVVPQKFRSISPTMSSLPYWGADPRRE